MSKKSVTIIIAVLAVVVLVGVCLGLQSCSESEQSNPGNDTTGQDKIVLEQEEDKDNVDDEEADDNETITGDDVVKWGDATEGLVGDQPVNKDNGSNNTSSNPVVDNNSTEQEVQNPEDTTKKGYTITYILNNPYATIASTTQKVTYGEDFTLTTPTITGGDDYRFVKWVITGTSTEFKSGQYTMQQDVSLTAVWEDNYSKNY